MRQESIGANNVDDGLTKLFDDFFKQDFKVAYVLDIESSAHGPAGNEINPSSPSNKAVLMCVRRYNREVNSTKFISNGTPPSVYKGEDSIKNWVDAVNEITTKGSSKVLLVGHNVKFDLRYLVKYGLILNSNLYVWDTALFDYLVSGQSRLFPSLEETCQRYFVPYKKNEEVTKAFNSGVSAENIDSATLTLYCGEDTIATGELFVKQCSTLEAVPSSYNAFRKLVALQNQYIKPLVEMENNGIRIDIDKLRSTCVIAWHNKDALELALCTTIHDLLGDSDKVISKPLASRALSAVFFGTDVHETVVVPDGHYKNGNPKSKKVKVSFTNPASPFNGSGQHKFTKAANGEYYSVDKDALERMRSELSSTTVDTKYITLIDGLLEYRKLDKIIGTYYEPMIEWTNHTKGNTIHPYYQNTATHTGRLSSAKPNGQNQPPEVTKMIVPLHKELNYVDVQVDFKQLEVCGLAQLSRDPTLIADIQNNVDIHAEIGRRVYRGEMTKAERRTVKGIVFGTIYGGGVNTLSATSKCPKKIVSEIQDEFFTRYSTLKTHYENVTAVLRSGKYSTAKIDKDGKVNYCHTYQTVTGRSYVIGNDPRSGEPSFTQTRNYPVQGWSTGDIVPLFISLFSYVRDAGTFNQPVDLITTVHDSLRVSCHESDVDSVKALMLTIANVVLPEAYEYWTKEKLLVPLRLDFEVIT